MSGRLRAFSRRPPAHIALAVTASLALAGLVVWQIFAVGPFRIDDAYITFSFSKNLATGHGPVFSHGVRVEGYSNFLWMVLNALPLVVDPTLDVYLSARLLAAPFLVLLLFATYHLARARVGVAWAFAATLLVAMHSDLMWALLSGLETVPYTALLTAAFACQAAPLGARRRRWALPLMTLAALMRIDGFLPLGFLLAWELLEARVQRRLHLLGYLRRAGPWLLLYATWFVWRYLYYGLPLPSTYYAKALLPILDSKRGWEYAHEKLTATGALLTVPFLILLAHRLVRSVWMLLLFALGHIAYVIRVGGDWMPFARFFVPIVPIACVLWVWAMADLAARARALRRWPRRLHAAALLVSVLVLGRLAMCSNNAWPDTDAGKRARLWFPGENDAHVVRLQRVAELLSLVVPSGKRLVTDYAGTVGYFTDAHVIDMWGLCNATIATRGNADGVRPMFGRTCHACYPELRPDYFHIETPWLRSPNAFASHADVVKAVWQADAIQRYLDVLGGFRSGRIVDQRDGSALFFLERRAEPSPPPRNLPAWARIDYPFGL
ncbi:MAG: hypothetical protein JXP73_18600 [Deltaproteobacteria bacterium]|nr:hypothetical protein [Deltaproteobacteria bacterium]